jgi:hypothetical protein
MTGSAPPDNRLGETDHPAGVAAKVLGFRKGATNLRPSYAFRPYLCRSRRVTSG